MMQRRHRMEGEGREKEKENVAWLIVVLLTGYCHELDEVFPHFPISMAFETVKKTGPS